MRPLANSPINLRLRRPTLYPVELRGRVAKVVAAKRFGDTQHSRQACRNSQILTNSVSFTRDSVSRSVSRLFAENSRPNHSDCSRRRFANLYQTLVAIPNYYRCVSPFSGDISGLRLKAFSDNGRSLYRPPSTATVVQPIGQILLLRWSLLKILTERRLQFLFLLSHQLRSMLLLQVAACGGRRHERSAIFKSS